MTDDENLLAKPFEGGLFSDTGVSFTAVFLLVFLALLRDRNRHSGPLWWSSTVCAAAAAAVIYFALGITLDIIPTIGAPAMEAAHITLDTANIDTATDNAADVDLKTTPFRTSRHTPNAFAATSTGPGDVLSSFVCASRCCHTSVEGFLFPEL